MKRKYLLIALLLFIYYLPAAAQSLAINTDGSTANASSILDVKSTAKGILIPRMTMSDRNLIATPATGLMIYQTDNTAGFYYYDGVAWVSIVSSGNNLWLKSGANIYNSNAGNVGIGTSTPLALLHVKNGALLFDNTSGGTPTSGSGTRMMWIPAKAAFRAGSVVGATWDDAYIGQNSFATGNNNQASGDNSIAMGGGSTASGLASTVIGSACIASGDNSTAMGWGTTASGISSTSMGNASAASGDYSTAMGKSTIASGLFSTAMGRFSTASAIVSTALGDFTTASGGRSTAMGFATIASGFSSTSMGYNTAASGDYSTTMGYNTTAPGFMSEAMGFNLNSKSFAGFVTGLYNDSSNAASSITTNNLNRIFQVGNGTADYARSNAMTILQNGNTGIGTTTPVALLHVKKGAVLFDSTLGTTPVSGAGTRLMWIPAKAAFRAGVAVSNEWDDANIGQNSVATGLGNKASGNYSTIIGSMSTASGDYSTSIGAFNNVTGLASTTMGFQNSASGNFATSIGQQNIASGDTGCIAMGYQNISSGDTGCISIGYQNIASGINSIAIGRLTKSSGTYSNSLGFQIKSKSFAGFVTGLYNDSTNASNGSAINSLNRIFQVGNGTADNARDNAMTILQSGNVGIGTTTPVALLEVKRGAVLFDSTIGGTPMSGSGTRMMWVPAKAALRAGSTSGSGWDNANIGQNSMAFGENTVASGGTSTAFGFGTAATNLYSTAMGYFTSASGFRSTGMGFATKASGDYSTSMGEQTIASGNSSTATGAFAKSKSYAGFVTGIYNDSTNAASGTAINDLNRLFQVGNGTADNARDNAMTILQSGNTGIGTTTPIALLEVKRGAVLFDSTIGVTPMNGAGTRMMWIPAKAAFRAGRVTSSQWNDANIGNYSVAMGENTMASGLGSTAIGNTIIASGDYSNATGYFTTASGDNSASMGVLTTASGDKSIAMGYLTIASGSNSVAMGQATTASGGYSTTMGQNTTASGLNSTAMGLSTTASGISSIAMGESNIASGLNSTTIGHGARASAFYSTAIGESVKSKSFGGFVTGLYNDSTNAVSSGSINSLNRVFQVGNGTADNARSNAMTILQNGNTGIGTTSPSNTLDVNGTTATDGLQVGGGTLFTKMQSGSVTVGSSGAGELSYSITFPVAFVGTPKVFATARNEPSSNYNDAFSVSVRSISNTGVTFNIQRTDSNSGWGQQLRVDWFAVE